MINFDRICRIQRFLLKFKRPLTKISISDSMKLSGNLTPDIWTVPMTWLKYWISSFLDWNWLKMAKAPQKSKEAKAKAASGGSKKSKKKWSKGKSRDKLQNLALFDKPTFDRLMKEVPKYKVNDFSWPTFMFWQFLLQKWVVLSVNLHLRSSLHQLSPTEWRSVAHWPDVPSSNFIKKAKSSSKSR